MLDFIEPIEKFQLEYLRVYFMLEQVETLTNSLGIEGAEMFNIFHSLFVGYKLMEFRMKVKAEGGVNMEEHKKNESFSKEGNGVSFGGGRVPFNQH